MSQRPKYQRILLKLSGEALKSPESGLDIDPTVVEKIAGEVESVRDMGVQVGIVIGGGNIFRGLSAHARGMDRVAADHMGMLATMINALALQDFLEKFGMPTRVMSAVKLDSMAEPFIRRRAVTHLEKGRVVIFGAGTGNPYFTTDTAAALRATEVGANVILKGTKVDGIYDADPMTNPNAVRYDVVSYEEALSKNLRIMDATAFTLCRENHIPIVVFKLLEPGNLRRLLTGENIGTTVTGDMQ